MSNSKYIEELDAECEEYSRAITQLRKDLAEREAEIAKLRVVLSATVGVCQAHATHSVTARIVAEDGNEALSTPPSTSYLEQWEKEKYGEPECWYDGKKFYGSVEAAICGDADMPKLVTLYARKD